MIKIYTDGSCPPQNRFGGWAFIVTEDGKVLDKRSGCLADTTNNVMELSAIYNALKYLKETNYTSEVILYSDSQYCVRGLTQWINKWKVNGWKSTTGDVKNQSLWMAIDELMSQLKVDFVWVRGHDVCEFNNLADKEAVAAGNTLKPKEEKKTDEK